VTRNEEREQAVLAYMRQHPNIDGWFRLIDLQWGWGTVSRPGVRVNGLRLNASAIKTALGRMEKKRLVASEPLPTSGRDRGRRWRLA